MLARKAPDARRERVSWGLAALLLVGMLAGSDARAEHEGYVLGVLPFLTPARLEAIFAPLGARLSEVLPAPVAYRSAADFDRFARAVEEARFDFAFVQPFDYVRFAAPSGYRPLVRMGEPLVGVFVVREDSDASGVADLRGARLALPPPQAAVSLLARGTLRSAGLVPARDLEVRNLGTHDACLQALVAREVDACVTAPGLLESFAASLGVGLRTLATTEPLAPPLFVAHERVDPAHVALVRQRLLDPAFVDEVIPFFAPRLALASDRDYAPVRALWRGVQEQTAGPLVQLVLGVQPWLPVERTERLFAPLALAIQQASGSPVRLQTASSLDRFTARLDIGHYDLAVLQPFEYLRVAQSMGLVPLVRQKAGIRAVVETRPESPLTDLADLRGKVLALPARGLAVTHLARCALRDAGLELGRDVTALVLHSHDACLRALASGQADACATSAQIPLAPDGAHTNRPIGESVEIPSGVLAAHPRVPEALRARLIETLLDWQETAHGPPAVPIGPFEIAHHSDYAPLAAIASGDCRPAARPAPARAAGE